MEAVKVEFFLRLEVLRPVGVLDPKALPDISKRLALDPKANVDLLLFGESEYLDLALVKVFSPYWPDMSSYPVIFLLAMSCSTTHSRLSPLLIM